MTDAIYGERYGQGVCCHFDIMPWNAGKGKTGNGPFFPREFCITHLEAHQVIAIIAILAALLLPVLGLVKARGIRTSCLDNLKQLSLGVHLYAGDSNDALLDYTNTSGLLPWFDSLFAYDPLVRRYVGLNGAPSPQDKVFSCPADIFY